jgi:PRC-barrel domain protein
MRLDQTLTVAVLLAAGSAIGATALLESADGSAAADRGMPPAVLRLAQTTPAPAAAETPPDSTTASQGDTSATVLDGQDVQGILGRKVVSVAGEDMGRVIDVVVDRAGQARAAVIDFGGFLGVGNRKVAVDWNALHFAPTGSRDDRIMLALTRDQVKDAPEYRDGKPLVLLGAADSLPLSPP